MPAREVDDDCVRRRLEGGRLVMTQAEEEHVGTACQRFTVRDERGQGAVQSEIERRRRLPGEGVRAERDDLELGVREDPVERLLACITRAPNECSREHMCLLCALTTYHASDSTSQTRP